MNLVSIISLGVTIIGVAVGVFIVFRMLGALTGAEKERQRLLAIGTPAHACILRVSMGDLTVTTGVHRQIQVHISVEVHREGTTPYPAHITSLISELQIPQVQPKAWLGIRVDPSDPQKIAIEALGVPVPAGSPVGVPRPGTGSGVVEGAALRQAYLARARATQLTGFQLPLSSKIGAGIALVAAAAGIGAGIYTSIRSVDGSRAETCKKATACCQQVSPSAGCVHYLSLIGTRNEDTCERLLDSYRHMGCH